MTDKQLWNAAERMNSPLIQVSQGIKCLFMLADAINGDDDQDALNFVAKGLRKAVEELDEAHSGLYRLRQQDSPSTEPTPLHSA